MGCLFAQAAAAAPTSADRKRARQLFEQSKPLQDAGKCPDAVRLLREAFALHESADIAANLGFCEASMGKYAAAAEHLGFAERELMPSATDAQRKKIARAFGAVKKHVAELALDLDPVDAKVTVDGQPARVRGGVLFAAPGKHAIEVSARGRITKALEVDVAKGQRLAETIVLEKDATAVGAGLGGSGAGGATGGSGATAGHAGDGGGAGQNGATEERSTVPVYVAGGVALAGVVAFAVFSAKASERVSERDDMVDALGGSRPCGAGTPHKSECARISDLDSDARKARTVGFVGLGVGVAAAVAGAAYWFWPREKSGAVLVNPTIGANGASFVVAGSF